MSEGVISSAAGALSLQRFKAGLSLIVPSEQNRSEVDGPQTVVDLLEMGVHTIAYVDADALPLSPAEDNLPPRRDDQPNDPSGAELRGQAGAGEPAPPGRGR